MARTEPDPVAESGRTCRWLLDAGRSRVEFRVPHLWGLMTVVGRFDRFDGSYDGRAMGLTIDAASLDTGHKKRDEHLRSADFFDVENHPQVSFRSTGVTEATAGTLRVLGELEAAGERVQLDLDVLVRAHGEELEIESETTVEQRLFGMTWSPLGTIRSPATLHVTARLTPEREGDVVHD